MRAARRWTPAVAELGLRVRVGVHTGEVEIVGGQARGVAVHAAARVASLAGPGEVLVSGTTHDLLDGSGLALRVARATTSSRVSAVRGRSSRC